MATYPQTVKRLLKPSPWFAIKTHIPDPPTKVFLNICTEPSIPSPPQLSDEELRRISLTEDASDLDNYYIPVILGDVRQDTDKSGKPCHVADCVVHPLVRTAAERIPEYRTLLIAIVLDQADANYQWNLSREISIPNMKSKGKPKEWTANLPMPQALGSQTSPALTEMVEVPVYKQDILTISDERLLNISISVPKLTKALHASSTLDLEARRLVLDCRPLYALDVVLGSELAPEGINVDRATAQWKVKEGQLVVRAPFLR